MVMFFFLGKKEDEKKVMPLDARGSLFSFTPPLLSSSFLSPLLRKRELKEMREEKRSESCCGDRRRPHFFSLFFSSPLSFHSSSFILPKHPRPLAKPVGPLYLLPSRVVEIAVEEEAVVRLACLSSLESFGERDK
jgi:hypothetical protein